MRRLFILILLVLCAASVYTYMTRPAQQTERPIISWKTDSNPQRYDQIRLFNEWCVKNGHVDAKGRPVVELKLDVAANQSAIIQAVSGVGGDVIDASVKLFTPMGVTTDLTDMAKGSKFSLDRTYPGARDLLSVKRRQHGYPCNLAVNSLWFNLDILKKFGINEVPEEWTPEEFERIGLEFIKRANQGLARREYFFVQPLGTDAGVPIWVCMARSLGADVFNETLTAAVCDDARFLRVLKLFYKWVEIDHLSPNASEVASAVTESGFGGANFSQFQSGKYASISTGRWVLVRMREFKDQINLTNAQFPMYGFKNLIITTRSAVMYAGSRDKQLTKLFFDFLADKEYNEYIVTGADGLPPNPEYALNNPEYAHPKGRANEGTGHANELKWALSIALPNYDSPYCKATSTNWMLYAMQKYFNGRSTAEKALAEAQKRYNAAIEDTLAGDPKLREEWERDHAIQLKINELKSNNKPIPAEWIKNPFHLALYRSKGMLIETPAANAQQGEASK